MKELTPREVEVTEGVANGKSNREIAVTMKVSIHTVRAHMRAILGKTDTYNRTELAVKVLKGLVKVAGGK